MQSNTNNNANPFGKYIDKFEVKSLKVLEKSKAWELKIRLKENLSLTEIKSIEDSISNTYKLSRVKITVDNSDTNKSAIELVKSRWDELKKLIFKENPAFIGFLKTAIIEFEEDKITITVESKKYADFLTFRKCNEVFEKYIFEYLNINTRILIKYKEENISHDEYISKFEAEEDKIIKQTMTAPKGKPSSSKSGASSGESNLNIILGKNFADMPIKLSQITEESGRVAIIGTIFSVEVKKLNNGKTIIIFNITDNSNSITAKYFVKEEGGGEKLIENIIVGKYVRIKGDIQLDPFIKELVMFPINIVEAEAVKRVDTSEDKRVELHAHTGMSSMDGFSSASQLVKRAKEWGHKAIAITDHGVVQAFPEAHETAKKAGIKVIYGVEGYFVNDGVPIVYNAGDRGVENEYIVFDIETTGLSPQDNKITEIGAVKIQDGKIVDTFSALINPEAEISEKITELTGITNEMVVNERIINEVLPEFLEFAGDGVLVAHNALFDWSFIKINGERMNRVIKNPVLDTLQMSRALLPQLKKHKLNLICDHLGIKLENHHRALHDAEATAHVFLRFMDMAKEREITRLDDINSLNNLNKNIKGAETHHIIILVKNQIGLKNLYKLISISHLEYFHKRPRIPKSLLLQYREGLIIGSACEAGEIYKGILNGMDESIVSENAKFYDYLEIQPNGNNKFLIRNGRVNGIEDLNKISKKIVDIADKLGKPVVATGDVHFLDPEDEVYRRIIMGARGYSDADEQAPLYFKSTQEMLEEFRFLGRERAHQVVIENPNKLADSIDEIKPIPDETYPPKIPGAEEEIRQMTMIKARSIYGDIIPEVVEKRLEKELNSIINNGYAVLYLIAQKLVTKSLRDGYLVGSRGSVGSSFVATMCDITEVNPLPPHYICPSCKHSHFIIDGSVGSGADLPDMDCQQCGTKYIKEGHDIPFETFLGFEGDKEPDIDLNFAGEYQSTAHKYTEELFGKGYVFRAGTIGTIAEKTAYGYIKKYFDERNIKLNNAEVSRLTKGCSGIKRTTGQHPGGVMIVPDYKDIHDFTPIQKPADDSSTEIITTHFDYHSISGRILKLDILGHDAPSIIKMLEDMTNFKASDVKLDDPDTMSLFLSPKAMEIDLNEIDCKVGSLGIPEFGTKFVRQMLMDTLPTTFAELVRIAGLSHGTDVWLNNAQELVRNGTAVLKDVISTRDDIMVYLIYQGLKPKMAFKIMESVRKGKGLSGEMEQTMMEQKVPQWYIDSCKKIKYMFPKAHAAAYVMMSFRIAYYKMHYPEAFYSTFFTVKLEDFDANLFIKGKEAIKAKWIEIEKLGNNATTKEKNLMTLLEVVYEMYLRGIKLLPIDLYRSDANKFKLTPEGILPPINALQGVGANAAANIVKVRDDSPFISMDELRERAKVSKSVIEVMKTHGCLKDLPENNQLSLF